MPKKIKKIKPTKNSGYTEDTSPEAFSTKQPDDSAPSRETHKFLQYPDGGQMPIWYRHQTKDREVVFRGHTDQKKEEIVVTLPAKSGTLAVYGEGGTIDLTDYATIKYSDEEDATLKNYVINNHYTKAQTDKIIEDIDVNADLAELTTQVEANTTQSNANKKDIEIIDSKIDSIQEEQVEQNELIETNKQGVSKNKTDTEQNTKDIKELKDSLNNTDDNFFGYEWRNDLDIGDTPLDGLFYATNGVTVVDEVKLTTQLHLSTIDQSDTTHHLESFEKGDVIECYSDGTNPAQGFFEVQGVEEKTDTYCIVEVKVIRSAGNWSDAVDPSGNNGNWKFNYQIGLEVDAGNYYSKAETDSLFTPITSFDDHEKRNVASFLVLEAELLRVAGEVILNYRGILNNEDDIKENAEAIEGLKTDLEDVTEEVIRNYQDIVYLNNRYKEIKEDVEDKASISKENTFNDKQTFNKNVTFKGAETVIVPPLSSRWHKYSVNPPKNADGETDTSEPYGVNYYLDAGNTWKNQFKISNRHGTAFEVRGGADMIGQLHSKWSYTGSQEEDDNIATVKYVNDAVDLSEYMTADETADFVEAMDKTYLVQANTKARELDQAYAVPLDGNTTKTGSMTLKTGAATPFEIQAADGSSIFKMWASGAVALEKPYTGFKDNELVTKKYVDDKVASGGSGGSGFTAGDQVAKTNGESTNVGGFWISNGNLYCKVS